MTAFALKLIAFLTMLIDHTAVVFSSEIVSVSPWLYVACRAVGRLAFPLFALLAAEGVRHTASPRKYLLRLLLFALISQIPFSLMYAMSGAAPVFSLELFGRTLSFGREFSVMVTLFLGVAFCLSLKENKPVLSAAVLFAAFAVDKTFGMDYGMLGVVYIAALWLTRDVKPARFGVMLAFPLLFFAGALKTAAKILFKGAAFTASSLTGLIYLCAMAAAALLLLLYNGREGRKLGILGYFFYPVHMLALVAIKFILS